jgi:hypothetical protein
MNPFKGAIMSLLIRILAKLGIPRSTLDSKIRSLKISTHRFKPSSRSPFGRNLYRTFGNFRKVGILSSADSNFFNRLRLVCVLPYRKAWGGTPKSMFKIQRSTDGNFVVLTLSGRIKAASLGSCKNSWNAKRMITT